MAQWGMSYTRAQFLQSKPVPGLDQMHRYILEMFRSGDCWKARHDSEVVVLDMSAFECCWGV